MSFGELLSQLQEGSNSYYLTTQELGVDKRKGVVQLHASPGKACKNHPVITPDSQEMF